MRIEDYALVGDLQTAALVGRNGSLDWLCLPRFDSSACFSALLGDESHGHWLIEPAGEVIGTSRRYRPGTLILETELETAEGTVRLVDLMPVREREAAPNVLRLVEGVKGTVAMRMSIIIRFDYGATVPWVEASAGGIAAGGGPNAVYLRTPVDLQGKDFTTVAEFTVRERESVPFTLAWSASHEPPPPAIDPTWALATTDAWWREWSGRCAYGGKWRDAVLRSLITLKALTYAPTGGIVAAPTTSLPEQIGGVRNWDYRYCWLRDATFTLNALLLGGLHTRRPRPGATGCCARVAGSRRRLQIMYGVDRRAAAPELELDWLPGYEGAQPVRVGNAASDQFQLDVYGEVMDTLHLARAQGSEPMPADLGTMQVRCSSFLETDWQRARRRHLGGARAAPPLHPLQGDGLGRVRPGGEGRASSYGLDGPVERWRELRDEIHAQVCERATTRSATRSCSTTAPHGLDASLLLIPLVGFLPRRRSARARHGRRDSRRADARRLCLCAIRPPAASTGCRPARVRSCPARSGSPMPGAQGRRTRRKRLFERLLALCNDVGLLAEEYDPGDSRQVGNFPQAFSHLSLVNTAARLSRAADAAATPA